MGQGGCLLRLLDPILLVLNLLMLKAVVVWDVNPLALALLKAKAQEDKALFRSASIMVTILYHLFLPFLPLVEPQTPRDQEPQLLLPAERRRNI